MASTYDGPVRQEPLAVELYNTVYASAGEMVDGLVTASSAGAWIAAVADRLPRAPASGNPSPDALAVLRAAVRDAFSRVFDAANPTRETLDTINAHSNLARGAPHARWRRGRPPEAYTDFGTVAWSDIVLATIAADAVEILTGPLRVELRRCGAPGCVLAFVRSHPRRTWCSITCGNRARQARHYDRRKQRARPR